MVDQEQLEAFRSRVLADVRLQSRLYAIASQADFLVACLAMAGELGIELGVDAIEAAMRDNRRTWFEANSL